jgi:hypothetical protein
MYAEQNLSKKSSKMLLIYFWKIAKAPTRPNGITTYLNNPNLVRNAVFHSSPFLMQSL